MLILTRKNGQSIHIGDDITVTVKEIRGNQIRIGVEAPANVKIFRDEIYSQITQQNKIASSPGDASIDSLAQVTGGEAILLSEGVLIFEKGLIGLENCKEFQLVTAEGPFFWLQCKDKVDCRFLVLPLPDTCTTYEDKITPSFEAIDYKVKDEVGIFLIVSVEDVIEKSSVNEIAPLFVNFRSAKAVQLLLDDDSLKLKKSITKALITS